MRHWEILTHNTCCCFKRPILSIAETDGIDFLQFTFIIAMKNFVDIHKVGIQQPMNRLVYKWSKWLVASWLFCAVEGAESCSYLKIIFTVHEIYIVFMRTVFVVGLQYTTSKEVRRIICYLLHRSHLLLQWRSKGGQGYPTLLLQN